jgi:uncharacterized protein HemY
MSESVRPDAATLPELLGGLREALGRGDDVHGERLAEAVLMQQPGHEPTLAYLSTRARLRGDPRHAIALAEQGLRQHPRSVLLLFNLGAALSADGHFAAAKVALQAAITEQSLFLFAHFLLGAGSAHVAGRTVPGVRRFVRA